MHPPAVRARVMEMIEAGINDSEVSRRTGIARTTIRDWRRPRYQPKTTPSSRPICPRCWRPSRLVPILAADYDELLGLYLGDCFAANAVGTVHAHEGRMTVLRVHSDHAACLLPQHGPGKKHLRPIHLEPWQQATIDREPWRFLRGCIRSDGCTYLNRTGPYTYLSYEFSNRSGDILDLFARTCEAVGVEYRRYWKAIRVYRRPSVALLEANVGIKR